MNGTLGKFAWLLAPDPKRAEDLVCADQWRASSLQLAWREVSPTGFRHRVRIPKLATGVRHAAVRAAAILIPPASIAIVFRPAPVDSRSRTIAAYRPGRSRSYRILDNQNRSKPS